MLLQLFCLTGNGFLCNTTKIDTIDTLFNLVPWGTLVFRFTPRHTLSESFSKRNRAEQFRALGDPDFMHVLHEVDYSALHVTAKQYNAACILITMHNS